MTLKQLGNDVPPPEGVARMDMSRLVSPRRRGRICERSDLLLLLDEALQTRVTLIVAPAGYGKTTLLTQWCDRLTEAQVSVAYYAASSRDREPAAFLTMIAAALAKAGVETHGSDSHRNRIRDDILLDDILLALELAGQPLVLVMDDFERLNEPAITALVKRLIDAAPASLHLVVSSRTFPAMPLSALEVAGDLRRIHTSQLRLARSELAWMLDLDPASPELGEIEARTQGWPVTAELYRLWRARCEGEQAPGKFGGHVAEVHDYLAEQLFSSLPAAQFKLLIDIADRDEVTAELVDFIRGETEGAALLQAIAEAMPSLMWFGARDESIVYRLHPLLLDHLRLTLARDPSRRSNLAARAASWYLTQSRFPEAVRAALDSRDDEMLAHVIRSLRPLHILIADGAATLRMILRELPDDVIARHPRLQIMATVAHFKAGLFVESRSMLERIRTATNGFCIDPDGAPRQLAVEGNFTDLMLLVQTSRYSARVEALCEKIMTDGADDPTIWGACDNVMMLVHQVRGQFDEAEAAIIRARRVYDAQQLSRYGHTQVLGHEVLTLVGRGRLRQAVELISAYQKQPGFDLPEDSSTPILLKLILAFIRYEQDFSETSVEALRKSFAEHSRTESWLDQYAISYPAIATRLFVREGAPAVLDFIAEAKARAQRVGLEALPDFLTFMEIEYRARGGDLSGARLLSDEVGLDKCACGEDELATLRGWRERDAALAAYVRLCLAEQTPAKALAVACVAARDAEAGERLRSDIKALLFCALARAAEGRGSEARADLLKAVMKAYPEKLIAPFAEEGAALLPMVDSLQAADGLDGYAQRHLQDIRRAISGAMARTDTNQLSARELEIVTHLAEGLSNKVIARRLGISDHTVKFHLKKVFSKLDVSSRRAAVARMVGLNE